MSSPSHSQPSEGRAALSEAEEEANCQWVSQIVTNNSAPVQEALETLARQRYGRAFSDLSPEQVMALAMAARVEGRPMTAAQRQMEGRCAAHQQRVMAKQSAAGGLRSLFGAQGFLDRWGRERLAGLGCDCPGFRPAGEDVEHRCETRTVCPGQQGGPRVPDPERGCRSIGASAWILQQLPDFYRILGLSPQKQQVRDVIAARERGRPPSACGPLPAPSASPPTVVALSGSTARPSPSAVTAPSAIAAAAACFASPTASTCQEALVRGDGLVVAAHWAGRDRCLGSALSARTLWALGADPRFTDLLIRFPEATRLRNEARIALRYLRADCRGLCGIRSSLHGISIRCQVADVPASRWQALWRGWVNELPLTVRRAKDTDLTVLARFGFALGQLHVGFDGERFAVPPGGEGAYMAFFRAELQRPEVVLLIAEAGPQPVGYAFVRMEPMSLVEIRRAGAWLHDIYVDPQARSGGIGRRLLEAAKEEALALGSSSLMLSASSHNVAARQLFERAGLRPTMVEMRIELGE